ncbi:MAG: methylated-DNA--protein-cysteine methyltransferase [Actinomycetota bacterium]|jgi:methylated-DNA-[protein]-cysteine S-methyltransferase
MERLLCTTLDSPVGLLTLVAGDRGLRAVLWPDEPAARVVLPAAEPLADAHEGSPAQRVLADTARQLREYFAGDRREFDLPLDPVGTEFQLQVWQVLRTIPYGSTITYGEQASRLGDRNKSRAVGAANGRNPISIVVPCHRVVGSTGALTGFAGGIDSKAWLLRHEQGAGTLPL